jgi:MoaA/NifB/PqqE/SkfB family radical SAM enzyme
MILYDQIRKLHIEVSSVCNASCPNCPRNIHGGFAVPSLVEQVMSLEQFKSYVDQDILSQLTHVRFCGNYGDPCTCPALPQIIEYIYSVNSQIQIEVNTNGGIRDAKWWATLGTVLQQNPSSAVIFSIDGSEQTNHIYRRGVVWERLSENFHAYINAGGKAIWEFLVFYHNRDESSMLRDYAMAEGFSEFRVKKPFGFSNQYKSQPYMKVLDKAGNFDYYIYPKDHDVAKNVDDDSTTIDSSVYQSRLDQIYNDNYLDPGYFDYMDSRPQGIDCMTARDQEVYISCQGQLYPCCFLGHASQMHEGRETMLFRKWLTANVGWDKISLKQQSIRDVVSSDYFKLIQQTWSKKHSEGRIAMCTLMCSSECSLNAVKNLYDQ